MRPWRAVLGAAIVAHALGWSLPVVRNYRGWQAFRVAFSPVWPFEQFRIEGGSLLALSVASALTNVLFVALAVLVALGRSRAGIAYAALAAALLDLHWPLSMGSQRSQLEIGYPVWIASFVLLALAAWLRRQSPRSPSVSSI
jgi:hypothetical protein